MNFPTHNPKYCPYFVSFILACLPVALLSVHIMSRPFQLFLSCVVKHWLLMYL